VRLEIDESLPAELADDLAVLGHDVDTVHGEGPRGATDTRVAAASRRTGRVLLTLDKGLGDIRRFPPRRYAGIVLFRLDRKGRAAVRSTVTTLLLKIGQTSLAGRLVVVTPSSIRTR
jgi:predicted nuclease of predicted toxin-antitoxin system